VRVWVCTVSTYKPQNVNFPADRSRVLLLAKAVVGTDGEALTRHCTRQVEEMVRADALYEDRGLVSAYAGGCQATP
jgi:hypothetical protein